MFSWLLSLLLILFGVGGSVSPLPPEPPGGKLDCAKPLSGTLGSGWGPTGAHQISSYITTLGGEQVTLTVRSYGGDVTNLSKPAPNELVRKLCEAINNVPASEWNRKQQLTDIGPLKVDVTDGNESVRGEVFVIDGNDGIRAVSEAERELTADLWKKLEAEAKAWEE